MTLDIDFVRSRFPALSGDWTYFDNAGGSQVLQSVADRISDYLIHSNVQHGASYEPSVTAGQRVRLAQESLARFVNAARPEELVMGSSTSMLLRQLSQAMRFERGDEIIVTNFDHEANIGPWEQLREQGVVVRTWSLDPQSLSLDLDALEKLFSERTRLLCVTHASNVLGAVNPVQTLARIAHQHGAEICVDAVAYAPHRIIDVTGWDVDYYVFSLYKVYGPHHAVLYGKHDALKKLSSINHYFVGEDEVPYKLQPGNVNYELAYGCTAVVDYLEELGRRHSDVNLGARDAIETAFDVIGRHEESLSGRLIEFLRTRNNIRIIGPVDATADKRVPTISFVVDDRRSNAFSEQMDGFNIGIRYGDFYARRLIEDLGLQKNNGVVRVSMVHYNTIEEVDRLISHLEPMLE